MVVGVGVLVVGGAQVAVERDVAVHPLDAHPLHEVEDVDEVARRDVPALDHHHVHEEVQRRRRAHAVVEHDSASKWVYISIERKAPTHPMVK